MSVDSSDDLSEPEKRRKKKLTPRFVVGYEQCIRNALKFSNCVKCLDAIEHSVCIFNILLQ